VAVLDINGAEIAAADRAGPALVPRLSTSRKGLRSNSSTPSTAGAADRGRQMRRAVIVWRAGLGRRVCRSDGEVLSCSGTKRAYGEESSDAGPPIRKQ
jgi:hypothetical protein